MIVAMLCAGGILAAYYGLAVALLRRGLMSLSGPGNAQGLTFSVVIAARNEEATIGRCLQTVLNQTLSRSRYEVIVVDDRSTDQTAACVEALKNCANLSLIRVSDVPSGMAPKKHAISRGIMAARNDIIVITDADCTVLPSWLDTIDRFFIPSTRMVQGITTYAPDRTLSSLFYGIQALDFLSHGIVAAAGIGAGIPINSNANNLAFTRSFFEEVGGYGNDASVVSGDDDLLLQRAARAGRDSLRFMADPAGAVVTCPTRTLRGVLEQRKRWASKTVHYNSRQRLFLGGIFLYYASIPLFLALGLLRWEFLAAGLVMLTVKLAGECSLLLPGARLFGREQLLRYTIPASLVQLVLVLFAVVAGVFGTFQWKEQRFARKVTPA